jgi:hypothetical protein
MIKQIAVVGHLRTIEIVRNVLHTYYKEISLTEIELNNSQEIQRVSDYLRVLEDDVDGVVFTGKIPYKLMNSAMFSHKPWVYIDQNYSQLQRTLLEGLLHHGYDIKKASIDSYEKEVVYNAYKEIQLLKSDLELQVSNHDIYHPNFLEQLQTFHKENVKRGVSEFCLTGISTIYEALIEEEVPCLWIRPTVDTIKNTIERLKLRQASKISAEREIVVVSVEPDLTDEYALTSENEYQLRLQRNQLAEIVTLFAQKIQAAIVEADRRGFLLFSTRNILEMETKGLKEITLLEEIYQKGMGTVSIGIGFGTTAREAKYYALQGMYRARKHGGHQAYVVSESSFIGRIKPSKIEDSGHGLLEDTLREIADRSGISLNTIFKLHCIIAENPRNRFTPKELSVLLATSVRSTNRLLEKLEEHKLIEMTGRQIVGSAGRPSRVFKISL